MGDGPPNSTATPWSDFPWAKHRRGLFGDRSLREGVKAYQAAELDEQMARMKHLSGGERCLDKAHNSPPHLQWKQVGRDGQYNGRDDPTEKAGHDTRQE